MIDIRTSIHPRQEPTTMPVLTFLLQAISVVASNIDTALQLGPR